MTRLINADELRTIKSIQSGDFNSIESIQKWIDNAPTVAANCKDCDGYEAGYSAGLKDAKRPQGKWICDYRTCKCSVCNFTTVIDTYNFCPNCGAYMRKGGAE